MALCAASSVVGISPAVGYAYASMGQPADPEFTNLVEEIALYADVEAGAVTFDEGAAADDGATEQVQSLGALLDAYSGAHQRYEQRVTGQGGTHHTGEAGPAATSSAEGNVSTVPGGAKVRTAGLPLWGNWCGPGHGGGRAMDTLDSLCRTHDQCYGRKGYFACSCDRALVQGINRNARKMGNRERAMAAVVSVYFSRSLCNPAK